MNARPIAEVVAIGKQLEANRANATDLIERCGAEAWLGLFWRDNGPRLLALVAAAVEMRAKMRTTCADRRYLNVWAIAQSHIGPYEGPDWIAEAAAFDRLAAPDVEESNEQT